MCANQTVHTYIHTYTYTHKFSAGKYVACTSQSACVLWVGVCSFKFKYDPHMLHVQAHIQNTHIWYTSDATTSTALGPAKKKALRLLSCSAQKGTIFIWNTVNKDWTSVFWARNLNLSFVYWETKRTSSCNESRRKTSVTHTGKLSCRFPECKQ